MGEPNERPIWILPATATPVLQAVLQRLCAGSWDILMVRHFSYLECLKRNSVEYLCIAS